jgi:hypothetical protein
MSCVGDSRHQASLLRPHNACRSPTRQPTPPEMECAKILENVDLAAILHDAMERDEERDLLDECEHRCAWLISSNIASCFLPCCTPLRSPRSLLDSYIDDDDSGDEASGSSPSGPMAFSPAPLAHIPQIPRDRRFSSSLAPSPAILTRPASHHKSTRNFPLPYSTPAALSLSSRLPLSSPKLRTTPHHTTPGASSSHLGNHQERRKMLKKRPEEKKRHRDERRLVERLQTKSASATVLVEKSYDTSTARMKSGFTGYGPKALPQNAEVVRVPAGPL